MSRPRSAVVGRTVRIAAGRAGQRAVGRERRGDGGSGDQRGDAGALQERGRIPGPGRAGDLEPQEFAAAVVEQREHLVAQLPARNLLERGQIRALDRVRRLAARHHRRRRRSDLHRIAVDRVRGREAVAAAGAGDSAVLEEQGRRDGLPACDLDARDQPPGHAGQGVRVRRRASGLLMAAGERDQAQAEREANSARRRLLGAGPGSPAGSRRSARTARPSRCRPAPPHGRRSAS